MGRKIISIFLAIGMVLSSIPGYAQGVALPAVGVMVPLSETFTPVILRGMTVHPDKPLNFDFIIDEGDAKASGGSTSETQNVASLRAETSRLVNYFLAALTVPEGELWVNLSPFEKDRIITDGMSRTELGRDLLAQDYVLKQLTASLISPEGETGKAFWAKVYGEAAKKFGTTDIPTDTFNKVWITPESASVYEKSGTVFITKAHMKVMLESDYLAAAASKAVGAIHESPLKGTTPGVIAADANERARQAVPVQTEILRSIIVPAIEKEVNEGKNFALLRQVFYSLVLAQWYKKAFAGSAFRKAYADRNKLAGVNGSDPALKDMIYQRYLAACRQGVFNYIKEENDPMTGELLPRKYFSGGWSTTPVNFAQSSVMDVMASSRASLQKASVLLQDSAQSPAVAAADMPAGRADAVLRNVPVVSLLKEAVERAGIGNSWLIDTLKRSFDDDGRFTAHIPRNAARGFRDIKMQRVHMSFIMAELRRIADLIDLDENIPGLPKPAVFFTKHEQEIEASLGLTVMLGRLKDDERYPYHEVRQIFRALARVAGDSGSENVLRGVRAFIVGKTGGNIYVDELPPSQRPSKELHDLLADLVGTGLVIRNSIGELVIPDHAHTVMTFALTPDAHLQDPLVNGAGLAWEKSFLLETPAAGDTLPQVTPADRAQSAGMLQDKKLFAEFKFRGKSHVSAFELDRALEAIGLAMERFDVKHQGYFFRKYLQVYSNVRGEGIVPQNLLGMMAETAGIKLVAVRGAGASASTELPASYLTGVRLAFTKNNMNGLKEVSEQLRWWVVSMRERLLEPGTQWIDVNALLAGTWKTLPEFARKQKALEQFSRHLWEHKNEDLPSRLGDYQVRSFVLVKETSDLPDEKAVLFDPSGNRLDPRRVKAALHGGSDRIFKVEFKEGGVCYVYARGHDMELNETWRAYFKKASPGFIGTRHSRNGPDIIGAMIDELIDTALVSGMFDKGSIKILQENASVQSIPDGIYYTLRNLYHRAEMMSFRARYMPEEQNAARAAEPGKATGGVDMNRIEVSRTGDLIGNVANDAALTRMLEASPGLRAVVISITPLPDVLPLLGISASVLAG